VTEPPKSLGPPTVVLVQRTYDNHEGALESLNKFGICFLYLSQERFTRHTDITIHRRFESAEVVTITYFYWKVRQSYIVTDQKKIYECWVLLLQNMGGKNPSLISSKKFLTEDLSSRSFSIGALLWVPPLNRSNKSLPLLHLKQHGTKPWVRSVLVQDLPDKVKDSQGYAGFKGVKVRLINNQWFYLQKYLLKVDP
jgi:hypothetical protein